ncbi:LytTR family DNA-binding domain-containing protein [Flagellimonas sp. DF-77]|uniref:LytR/AlgR family response regulator transcription factor n=1 Tax=Flagellimonas algarum TaxID=3230298 RepID=UPI00339B5A35
MMRIAIIDDEVLARKVLEEYCAKINTFALVLSTGNPLEFINFAQQEKVDLIFLDIEMPELNGLEILNTLVNPPKVILTTAYSEYALKSYDYGVVDYLLKPIKLERFLKAINKVNASALPDTTASNQGELQIKHDGIPVSLPFASIQYIQSFGNYVKIFTDDRMYLVNGTLTHIASQLSDHFERTHKSYIANLDRVEKATRTSVQIQGKQVPISASYKLLVQQKLGKSG